MILVCPACSTRYVVPDSAIGVTGRQVRCATCRHSWFQDGRVMAEENAGAGAAFRPETRDLPTPSGGPSAHAPDPAVAERAGEAPAAPDMPENAVSEDIAATAHSPRAGSSDFGANPASAEADAAPSSDLAPPASAPQIAAPLPPTAKGWADRGDNDGELDGAAESSARRPRRNPAKVLTLAALLFALAVGAGVGAIYLFGVPAWLVNMGLVTDARDPDLLLDMPRKPERRTLPNGAEYFAFSGRIVNASDHDVAVPPIRVELRDRQNRLVFEWTVKPPVAQLAPGAQASFSESRLDIPRNADSLTMTFADAAS